MSVSIYIWGTTPESPASLDMGDWAQYIPFSTAPDGTSSLISISEVVPGTSTAHLELYDLTNQFTFAFYAPIWIVDDASGENLFTGFVQKSKMTVVATYRLWAIDCVDINFICDTTLVGVPDGSNWEITASSTGPIATNVDPNATAATPHALFSAYWLYGVVSIDTTTYVDTTLIPSGLAPNWDRISLRQAMDNLAGMCGPLVAWWIDQGTGHASGSTCYLHFASLANVTNIGVAGSGTLLNQWGWLNGGPLTLLMPYGQPNAIPGGGIYAAPYAVTDLTPDYTTTWDAENVSLEADYSSYRFSLYVRGATDYTTDVTETSPGPPPVYGIGKVYVGGTGWVGIGGANGGDGGSSWLSDFYDQPNAVDHATRNSLGSAALRAMTVPIARGTADLILDPDRGSGVKPFHAGQNLVLTSNPMGIYAGNFFVMGCVTTILSGTDVRRVALQWGTAAKLNTAQRRAAQKSAQAPPPVGATALSPSGANASLTAGNSTVVSTPLVNAAGQPWAIPGQTVDWTFTVTDATTGADITASATGASVNPTSSVTDSSGRASTTLTTDSTLNNCDYHVTAEVKT